MKAKIDKIKFGNQSSKLRIKCFEIPIEINRLALKALAENHSPHFLVGQAPMIKIIE
jgi:hypothetical protein